MAAHLLLVPGIPREQRFTRQEVTRLEQSGQLPGRHELINGELIDKMGQNPPHASAVRAVVRWLTTIFGAGRVQGQLPVEAAPIDQDASLPEPDVAVFVSEWPEFDGRHPRGDELSLIVEISDSSSRFDLSTKVELYARAGVPEYWVLDIPRRRLVVHRKPCEGGYLDIVSLDEFDSATFEGESVGVSSLLPKLD